MNLLDKKRVAIIENDKIWMDCLSYLINSNEKFVVVGTYETSTDAMSNICRNKPDIILTEIELPIRNGLASVETIKEKLPHTEVIVVSSQDDNDIVFNAFRAGASGYIIKSANYLEVLYALDEVVRGGAPMSLKVTRMVVHNFHMNPVTPFTKREHEVLHLIAKGKTYGEISDQLFISKETTKTHIRNIYSKLEVNKKSEALEIASKHRYI